MNTFSIQAYALRLLALGSLSFVLMAAMGCGQTPTPDSGAPAAVDTAGKNAAPSGSGENRDMKDTSEVHPPANGGAMPSGGK
jgi:hypothetical protein